MKIGEYFSEGGYLTARDFHEGPDVCTIVAVREDTIGAARKLVLVVEGELLGKRELPLNRVNANTLAILLRSEETEDWTGSRVVLYLDPTVEGPRGVTGGIRIRAAGQVDISSEGRSHGEGTSRTVSDTRAERVESQEPGNLEASEEGG